MSSELKDFSQTELPALLNLVSILMGRLTFLWNFYAILNFAVGGWLFSGNTPWPIKQKAVVTVIYAVVASISFVLLRKIYEWLDHALREINEAANHLRTHTVGFKKALQIINVKPAGVVLAGHVLFDCLVVYLIWKLK